MHHHYYMEERIGLKHWLLNNITERTYLEKTSISDCMIFRFLFKPKININALLTLGAYYVTFNSSRSLSSHSKSFSIAIVPYRKGFDHFLPDTCFIPLFYIANFQLIVTDVIVVLRIFKIPFFKYLLFYTEWWTCLHCKARRVSKKKKKNKNRLQIWLDTRIVRLSL